MLVVVNRLPIAEGQEARFEKLFTERAGMLDDQSGCDNVDLLRPVEADYYVIQSVWESREAFEQWRTSDAFQRVHDHLPDGLFTGPNQLEIYEPVE